ncbi:MAG: hypothetical protein LAQ30_05145 [Acidobacteriia bacterium]|nr:hypothetical protein [Terriglobia bacterium]
MKKVGLLLLLSLAIPAARTQSSAEIRNLEAAGDAPGSRAALARAAQNRPNDLAALANYAEFLERYGDPASREAYGKLLAALRGSGDGARAGVVARRLAYLDLLAGDRSAAERDLEAYAAAGGKRLTLGDAASPADQPPVAHIPGPLRSFARMAAIPPDSSSADILPALARNVVTNGYEASHSNEALEPTEYLKLVHRYLSQARELQALAGDQKTIRIDKCDSPNVAELLRILGYRMRGGCGSEVVLETVNAARAFLTTDSGFPLNPLEEALRTNRPFTYDYQPTAIPVLFGPDYWMAGVKESPDFLETLISDPSLCRLYLGLSKLDPETAEALRKAVPFPRLKIYAHVLDFFGGMFEIRGGRAVTPGSPRAAGAWGDLVGVSPDQGGAFFDKLLAKDDGWMASLYDALARIQGPVLDYLTEPARMKRFYAAIRGRVTSPGPARPVFRSNADMMLLTTRLRLDPDGKPHIPGNLEVWKNLFVTHPQGKYDGRLTRAAGAWKDPDDLVEALFALCRKAVDNQPLKIFMALSDIDRNRPEPLQPATVDRLARDYKEYGSQYPLFSESRNLSDKSILAFLDTAQAIAKIHDPLLHSDAAGAYKSLVGLWQMLVRQGNLPADKADAVFAALAEGFAGVRNSRDLFDAGRQGVGALLAAAPPGKGEPQERIVDLLGGGSQTAEADARQQATREMERILEAQLIVSLDDIFQFADHLDKLAQGEKINPAALNKLASRISEIQLPRPTLSGAERNASGFGYWTDKHIDAERSLNLRAAIEKAAGSPEKLKDIRGILSPLLRDTLLAFNYAYYAPPGAQILYTNALFVRSHDFVGIQSPSQTWRSTEIFGTGWPSNAGGRLVGSLAGLPYALASAEQNFLIPAQTQALIWGDLVPQILVSATVPRWWNVTPAQVHWVGLHIRYGRELLAESVFDPVLRRQTLEALARLASPARTREVGRLLGQGEAKQAADAVTPSELFSIARDLAPKRSPADSCVLAELRQLAETAPRDANYAAISRAFGTPKPTLVHSYVPELLHLRTFPTLMGYSSRILAESWESNTLYWAALADELNIAPAELNARIPEWTQKVVERIFASNLDDWPALLKSLREVGDEERARTRAAVAAEQKAALQGFSNR